jgi:hypothetical protein
MTPAVQELTDTEAITALALVLDHDHQLPDPTRLKDLDTAAGQAATHPGDDPDTLRVDPTEGPVDAGDLARATLTYLNQTRPDLTPVITQAIQIATTPADAGATRFDPLSLTVGALVVLALQTEITLDRDTSGKWHFRLLTALR